MKERLSYTRFANNVKFAHQSLCNPKISTLLKATKRGFLKGCLYISVKLINKYLNPSPATAKGHMKRPRHGISTTPKTRTAPVPHVPVITFPPTPAPSIHSNKSSVYIVQRPVERSMEPHLIISEDNEESIANIFAFGAFADKNNGIVYHDLTGSFPFMSLDGSVCFFVLYHYESNCILPAPILGLDDVSIFNVYKMQFELAAKGFTPKLNVMDNQATKHIKNFLQNTSANCNSLNPTTIKSMLLYEQYKPSRMLSLQRWLQWTVNSPYNCGTGSHRKSETHSTSCGHPI
jgi:hypothetical protein